MKASYHTHTYRCHHAFGTEEEYIEKAIAEDIKILGFSDHAPMPYKNGYVSYYKMHPSEIDEYFSVLLSLKKRYEGQIEIKIGFETEYYPSLWEECLRFWEPYPIDYFILGQHFVPEEGDRSLYSGFPSDDKGKLKRYTDAVIKGMNTGIITYLAHPDLINYTGQDKEYYLSEMRRIILEANRLRIPLEFNLLGMAEKRNYPRLDFWREAAALGAEVIIGCDSHSPARVADKREISMAQEFLASLSLNVLDEIELKEVKI